MWAMGMIQNARLRHNAWLDADDYFIENLLVSFMRNVCLLTMFTFSLFSCDKQENNFQQTDW